MNLRDVIKFTAIFFLNVLCLVSFPFCVSKVESYLDYGSSENRLLTLGKIIGLFSILAILSIFIPLTWYKIIGSIFVETTDSMWWMIGLFPMMFISNGVMQLKLESYRRLGSAVKQAWLREHYRHQSKEVILFLRSFVKGSMAELPKKMAKGAVTVSGGAFNRPVGGLFTDQAVVAIGQTNEEIGDSNLMVFLSDDDRWESMFILAARMARVIIAIPGTSSGLVDELDSLRKNHLLNRTVFLMPPASGLLFSGYLHKEGIETEWQNAREAWQDRGLFFPEYDKKGKIFTISDDGEVNYEVSLQGDLELRKTKNEIINLIAKLYYQKTTIAALIPLLEQLEASTPLRNVFLNKDELVQP